VLNRYKKFKSSKKRGYEMLRTLRKLEPKLFYHWQIGFKEM
jgi:hypothetical protein